MDRITKEARSRNMAKIRSKDTKPEVFLRKALHKAGFRYRLNCSKLPGKPDIVLKKYGAVIFVNGCFWHGHQGCPKSRIPETNRDFWLKKIESNMARDEKNIKELRKDGWRVLVVWTCAFGNKKLSENTVEETISWLKSSDEFRGISNQQPPERAAKIGTSEE